MNNPETPKSLRMQLEEATGDTLPNGEKFSRLQSYHLDDLEAIIADQVKAELNYILDNASGGGSWRRVISQRLQANFNPTETT